MLMTGKTATLEDFSKLGVEPEFLLLDQPRTGKDGIRWSALKFSFEGKCYFMDASVVMQNSSMVSLYDGDRYLELFGELNGTNESVERAIENLRLPDNFSKPELIFSYVEIEDKDFSESYSLLGQEDAVLSAVVGNFMRLHRIP